MKCIPVFLLSVVAAAGQDFTTGQAARLVVGQPNGFSTLDTNSSNVTIGSASGVAVAGNTLFVCDSNAVGANPSNNRVLIFNNISSQLPAPTAQLPNNSKCPACVGQASVVLGQPDFVTTTVNQNATQNSLRNPQGVASDGVHLVVADTDDNRILIWNSIPTNNNQNADIVVGQPNFTSNAVPGNTPNASSMRGPQGVWIQNGKLFVADTQNNRVLIFNQIPTKNGVAADVVVGEPNFTTYVNPDITQQESGATASSMLAPVSVTSDGTRMFVTDLGFNRVLIFNTIPTANGAPADVALGQPDLVSSVANNAYTGSMATSSTDTAEKESPVLCTVSNGIDLYNNPTYPPYCSGTMSFPRYALDVGGRLVVADGGNDRLLMWDKTAPVTGSTPDIIIGQTNGEVDIPSNFADSMETPTALAWDGENLYVSDTYNRRVLVFTIGTNGIAFEGIRNAASLDVTARGSFFVSGTIQAGDVITVTVNSFNYTYTVVSTDTLQTITANLAAAINGANNGAGDPNVTASVDPITNTQLDLTAKVAGSLENNISYFSTVTPAAQQATAKVAFSAQGNSLTGGGNAANIAPGTVVSIFGTNLSATTVSADTSQTTLPTELGGTQVYFNGIAAPLFMVSPTQINAQFPWELAGPDCTASSPPCSGVSAFVRSVMSNGQIMYTSAVGVPVVGANPGLYFQPGTSNPQLALAYHGSSYSTAIISIDGAVTPGTIATITVNGRKYSYTASALDTLDSLRSAMLAQLNHDPQVTASVAGLFDRIILRARIQGPQGDGIPITGNATGGSLTVSAFDTVTCCSNIAGAPVTNYNPAVPGEVIVMYATGLGLPILTNGVAPLVQTGVQYPKNGPITVPQTENFVSSIVGGSTADVLQSTMLPGAVGQYQVVLHLNSNLITSTTTLATISQADFTSNQVSFNLVAPSGNSGLDPLLNINSSHSGNFYEGQNNAAYVLTVTNNGGGNPTSGQVKVTETLPTGMTLVQMIGDGWTCNSNVCTRSDALLATLAYPPITVIVNVASTAVTPETNTAVVSGGSSPSSTGTDVTVVNTTSPSNPPALSVSIKSNGTFTQGQQNATFTVTVSNKGGASSTSGTIYANDILPASLTVVSMSGTNWVCTSVSCSRSDALGGGSSYDPLTITVNVASNAPASVVTQEAVSGGGSGAVIGSVTTAIQQ